MRLLEPSAQIWMKMDRNYQRQKCRPMTLVSGHIRFMRIFAGVRLGVGVKRRCGLSSTWIFWQFRWLRLRKLQSYDKQYYMTICYPLSAGNWLQNEWPWVAISCLHPSLASTSWNSVERVWMSKIIQPLRLCGVLCIARSVSQPRETCAADVLFLCGSWASCNIL